MYTHLMKHNSTDTHFRIELTRIELLFEKLLLWLFYINVKLSLCCPASGLLESRIPLSPNGHRFTVRARGIRLFCAVTVLFQFVIHAILFLPLECTQTPAKYTPEKFRQKSRSIASNFQMRMKSNHLHIKNIRSAHIQSDDVVVVVDVVDSRYIFSAVVVEDDEYFHFYHNIPGIVCE